MSTLRSKKDDAAYQHYTLHAFCGSLEGGFIDCHTPKNKPRLETIDFYRTYTPIDFALVYGGAVKSWKK